MAEVLDEFHIRIGKAKLHVAGCRCTEGTLQKHLMYKVVRSGETIYKGILLSAVASLIPARYHTFVEIDHEIISTVILLLLLKQEGLLSVTSESMCTKYWLIA